MRPEGDSRRQRNKIAVLSSTLLLAAVFMTAAYSAETRLSAQAGEA